MAKQVTDEFGITYTVYNVEPDDLIAIRALYAVSGVLEQRYPGGWTLREAIHTVIECKVPDFETFSKFLTTMSNGNHLRAAGVVSNVVTNDVRTRRMILDVEAAKACTENANVTGNYTVARRSSRVITDVVLGDVTGEVDARFSTNNHDEDDWNASPSL